MTRQTRRTSAVLVTAALMMLLAGDLRGEAQSPLTIRLQQAYQKVLEKDPDADAARKAADLFASTDQSSHAWDYRTALAILRERRTKAGVLLLLSTMLQEKDKGVWLAPRDCTHTLVILTGADLKPSQSGQQLRAAVAELAEDFLAHPDKLTTDLDTMSTKQVERICALVAEDSKGELSIYRSPRESQTAYDIDSLLGKVKQGPPSGHGVWIRQDLCAAMTPILLQAAGYSPTTQPAKPATAPGIPYENIPLLAQLRKDGKAELLDKLLADGQQPAAVRLCCALAIYAAGEQMPSEPLLDILDHEQHMELRLPAIISLRYCYDAKMASSRALTLIDDRNGEICAAAIYVLREFKPVMATAKIAAVIDKCQLPEPMFIAFNTLADIQSEEALSALARFLEAAQEDAQKAKYLNRAYDAFRNATGYKGASPWGRKSDADLQKDAIKAVDWWRNRNSPPAVRPGGPDAP